MDGNDWIRLGPDRWGMRKRVASHAELAVLLARLEDAPELRPCADARLWFMRVQGNDKGRSLSLELQMVAQAWIDRRRQDAFERRSEQRA